VIAAVLVAVLAGICIGVPVGAVRTSRRLGPQLEALHSRMDAYRLADTRTDLDVVGPISGQNKVVHFYDQDAEQ
jgi:hypothetical protein